MTWQFVDLVEMRVSIEELRELPKYDAAFVVMSGLATNEITSLLRSHLLCEKSADYAGNSIPLKKILAANRQIVDRVLSAKLFEYLRYAEKYLNQLEQAKADRARWSDYRPQITAALTSPGGEIAAWLRNKVTNHYDKNFVSEFLDQAPASTSYSIYLHEKLGNNWDLLGEEIIFAGKFWEESSAFQGDFGVWRDWLVSSARVIMEFHGYQLRSIFQTKLQTDVFREKREIVDDRLIAELGQSNNPIFWKHLNGMDR